MKCNIPTKLTVAAALALTMAGCSSTGTDKPAWVDNLQTKVASLRKSKQPEAEPAPILKVTDKPQRTTRELTLAWDNEGRAGAAVHKPAYVHVLHESRDYDEKNSPYADHQHSDHDQGRSPGNRGQGAQTNGNFKQRAGQGYSYYELQRWGRYCDNGKGMDERDWRFVASEQYKAPLDALGTCRQPNFDYSHYLDAWTRFCTGSDQYSSFDKNIVANSSRPYTVVNPCRALSRK